MKIMYFLSMIYCLIQVTAAYHYVQQFGVKVDQNSLEGNYYKKSKTDSQIQCVLRCKNFDGKTLLKDGLCYCLYATFDEIGEGGSAALFTGLTSRWELITTKQPVCYGGQVASVPLTKSGFIKSIRLMHHSGGTTCGTMPDTRISNWGCFRYFSNDAILTVITDSDDNIIFPVGGDVTIADANGKREFKLPGFNIDSTELVFYAPKSHLYYRGKGEILKIYFLEDYFDYTTSDNGGPHCVNVFVSY